jgi:hypothetical protein
MKKVLLIIAIMILAACSMSPGPTDQQLRQDFGMTEEAISELRPSELIEDTIVKDTSRKERKEAELKELKKQSDTQQKEVLEKMKTLEEQHTKLDSILEKKKNGNSY